MAPPSKAELAALTATILDTLRGTRYSCSTLALLSGGSANFVYRGELVAPLSLPSIDVLTAAPPPVVPATVKTVIVKHFAEFLAVEKEFKIDVSRCFAEAALLAALTINPTSSSSSSPYHPPSLPFRVPRLLHFDEGNKIQVQEDVSPALPLLPLLVSSSSSSSSPDTLALQTHQADTLARDLGRCLRAFHDWSARPEQAELRKEAGKNGMMREIKWRTTYGSLARVLARFDDDGDGGGGSEAVLGEEWKGLVVEVQRMAERELGRGCSEDGDGDGDGDDRNDHSVEDSCWGALHGDFWAGNVLLQGSPTQGLQPNNLIIIDWEMAHYGHRAYDLGMFIGDLCEKEFLDSSTSARSAIGGFVDGYGELGDELAFRTAIHAGAHFAHWSFRRPPDADLLATPERITEAMKLARDYVLRAWLRDREWFRGTTLAPLFGF